VRRKRSEEGPVGRVRVSLTVCFLRVGIQITHTLAHTHTHSHTLNREQAASEHRRGVTF